MMKMIKALTLFGFILVSSFVIHQSYAEIGHLKPLGEIITPPSNIAKEKELEPIKEKLTQNIKSISRSDMDLITKYEKVPTPILNQTLPEKIQPLIPYSNNIQTTSKTLKYKIIDVMLSESCKRMIENNVSSTCPRISDLIKFDTSNQHVSGKFILSGNDVIRTKPQYKNHYMIYNSPVVCIDCISDFGNPDTTQNIILEPGTFTYINKTETSQNARHFTTYESKYIPDCNTATISYSPKLLNETINYFLSGCTMQITPTNKTNTLTVHHFTPDQSVQIHYNNYIKNASKLSLGNCINIKCDIPSYGKKW